MKTLHIGKYYHPFNGGIENFTQDLVESATYQQQVKPYLLVHQHQNVVATVEENVNGILVTRVKKLFTLLYSPISLTFLVELNKTIKTIQPDILHIHMPNLSAFWCLFSTRARKIPWVIHWHADVLGEKPDWRIKMAYQGYQIFEKFLLKRAKAIIVTSPPYLKSSVPLKEFKDKAHVIPLGLAGSKPEKDEQLNAADSDNLVAEMHYENTSLSLLIIGRLTYYKGHQYLLNAVAQLENTNLTIIGVGELETALKEQVKALSLAQRVKFLGSVDDETLKQSIQHCDLLCLPSIEKTEAFGLVLLEAAQLAKPALVTSVKGSGMSWVVQNKKTGIVVEPNSVEALVIGIEFAKNNKTALTQYGMAAQENFYRQFSIDAVAGKTVDLYQKVLDAETSSA